MEGGETSGGRGCAAGAGGEPATAPIRSFDALSVGDRFALGTFTATRETIVDFARRFDPQPFHLDEAAARDSVFGGLVASGLHTLCETFAVAVRSGVWSEANLAGAGLDELRWPRPVRPGDVLSVAIEVVALTPSRSRPDRGVARIRYLATNREGESVLSFTIDHVLKRDGGGDA
jgi:acyl dehydratase